MGYGDVTPHNAAGRVVACVVMLTAIPKLASVFALVTGAAAAAGVRRVLAMGRRFPPGGYRLSVRSAGRFLLGIGEDPVAASGDRLLIAQRAYAGSAPG